MANDLQTRAELGGSEYPGEPQAKSSGCLKGCLIVIAVLVLLAVVAGLLVWKYGRGWTADFVARGVNQAIDISDLPDQEKIEVKREVARVADAFREGRMSWEQAGQLMEKFTQSPLMSMLVVSAVDKKYLAASGLSDDEKAGGRLDLQRFVRGLVDGKIPQASVDAILAHIADRQPNGEWKLRDAVSDEDLRAFLSTAKAEADKANIPPGPIEFDPSDEFKRIVDEALGEN